MRQNNLMHCHRNSWMNTASGSSSAISSQYGSLISDDSFIGFQGSIGSGVFASTQN
jgi:hypothetical protein